jgi:hypothetical protein
MKKILLGLAVGATVFAGAVPVSAGFKGGYDSNENSDDSIWEIVDGQNMEIVSTAIAGDGVLADLILIAGMATMLDACGNGKPFYTLFAPIELGDMTNGAEVGAAVGGVSLPLEIFLDEVLGASVADLQATPAVVRALLNDHLVNGSFSPWQLDSDSVTTLTARSGFVLRNENGNTINDLNIAFSEQACNGWVYGIFGVIDSTPQVPTEGLNSLDTPTDGTPGGSNSLPDTL